MIIMKDFDKKYAEINKTFTELENYLKYREQFFKRLSEIEYDYKKKILSFEEYQQKQQSLLRDKSKIYWSEQYGKYCIFLARKLSSLTSELREIIRKDKSQEYLTISKY